MQQIDTAVDSNNFQYIFYYNKPRTDHVDNQTTLTKTFP